MSTPKRYICKRFLKEGGKYEGGKYGLSADTLRYGERIGLSPPVPRSKSGIRDYGETSYGWIGWMKCICSAGVQIEALIEYAILFRERKLSRRQAILVEQRENRRKYQGGAASCSTPLAVSAPR